jgi:hypothetical protein
MESEANDDILDVHHYGKINCFLRCPDVVAENQKEVMRERTHSITEDRMHRYNGILQDYSHCRTGSSHWPHSPSVMDRGRGQSFLL